MADTGQTAAIALLPSCGVQMGNRPAMPEAHRCVAVKGGTPSCRALASSCKGGRTLVDWELDRSDQGCAAELLQV